MNLMKKRKDKEDELLAPMCGLQKRMNDVFEDFFKDFGENLWPWRAAAGEKAAFQPRLDVAETEKEITVCAELPGMSDKDIEVTLDHGVLTIKGEKSQEKEDKQKHYHYVERQYGAFYRRIPLPVEIEQNKIEANFKNGILNISLPKKESTITEGKRIEIKGS